jgi:uncharacterized protein (TIGR04255 family)
MRQTRPALPDFDDPPVIEVVLSVQFERPAGFRIPHLGLLWTRFRDRFPHFEDHAPLSHVIETFGIRQAPKLELQLVSGDQAPAVRCWFVNEARTELVQLQTDRFVHNWRKVGEGVKEGEQYPRYKYIRKQFERELEEFQDFLLENKLGNFLPNQCEITYINHIIAGEGWKRHNEVDKIISILGSRYSERFPLRMEDARFSARYLIPDCEGNPIGRMHVSLDPAFRRTDEQEMYVLTLTARGKPNETSVESALKFLDAGRQYIVQGFASITTPRMHRIWRRKDA